MMIGHRVFGANGDDVSIGPNLPSPVSALAPNQPSRIQVVPPSPGPGVETRQDDIAELICLLRLQGVPEQNIPAIVRLQFVNVSDFLLLQALAFANTQLCPPAVAPPPAIVPITPGRGGALKPFLIVGGILVGIIGVALIAAKMGSKKTAA